MIKLFKNILLTLIGIAVIVVALLNRQLVTVVLAPSGTVLEMPLFLLIFILLMVGILLGAIANMRFVAHWRCRARKAEERNGLLEEEVTALRVIGG